MKPLWSTLLLLSLALPAFGQMQLVDTFDFGKGLTLPNPASDKALIATKDFLFASDQEVPLGREGAVYVYTNNAGAWQVSQILRDQIYPTSNRGWFGYALAYGTNSYGDWLAVDSTWSRATNASSQGLLTGSGDIQMFKLNPSNQQWEFFQYIIPPVADEFGNAPAISGDWMLCGAFGHFYNSDPIHYFYSSAAFFYQFDGTNWVLRQGPFLSSDGTIGWNFAYATALEGTNAFIYGRYNSRYEGAVYLYELRETNWVETGSLHPNVPKPAETFGIAYIQCLGRGDPGVKDDLLIVGAPMRASQYWTGGVYFFRHDGTQWLQIGSYFPTNIEPKTYFANSGDAQGDRCVIGCRFADWTANFCCPATTDGMGQAYVFKYDGATWNLEDILAPTNRQPFDWFGSAPATDGTNVYVVSPGAYSNGNKVNRLYTFSPVPQNTEILPPPFAVTNFQQLAEGLFLAWPVLSNRVYTVEQNADWTSTEWFPANGVEWPISSNQILLPTPTLADPAAFFRVRAE